MARVAVSTTDGKTIHQHFGHTREFHIVDIENGDYQFIESRQVTPACNQFGHNESAFDNILAILSDCEAVIVGKIGEGASTYLIEKGMRVFEVRGIAEEILEEFAQNQAHYFPEREVLA
ncbi:dinitrogenase iron-molybdenum cofactor [Clostridia bacterium]|nr:dinitrogenase iron-molybdenum cofactor [Clostridia bacterium]